MITTDRFSSVTAGFQVSPRIPPFIAKELTEWTFASTAQLLQMTIKSCTLITQIRNESLARIHNASGLDTAAEVTVGKRKAVEQLPDN